METIQVGLLSLHVALGLPRLGPILARNIRYTSGVESPEVPL